MNHFFQLIGRLVDKLKSDKNNDICLYIDPLIDNEFQKSAVRDLQSVSPDPVRTISHKVKYIFRKY